jgi:uncharacterized protein
VRRRVEAVGRTAFSNYIFQSLVCTTLFYATGLALFGTMSRASLFGIVAGLWTLQLFGSSAWLARWRMGPLEWIWRRLTYGRSQAQAADAARSVGLV